MKESEIQNRALLALSKGDTRLFRNNTAMGWAGKVISHVGNRVTLDDARPIHAGLCVGSSDTIGWHTVTVTPEMINNRVAVFTAIEFKAGWGRVTPEQATFGRAVEAAGGLYCVAYSVEDAAKLLNFKDKNIS